MTSNGCVTLTFRRIIPLIEDYLAKYVGNKRDSLAGPIEGGGRLQPSAPYRHWYGARDDGAWVSIPAPPTQFGYASQYVANYVAVQDFWISRHKSLARSQVDGQRLAPA